MRRRIGSSGRVLQKDAQNQINKFMNTAHEIILKQNLDLNQILNLELISVSLDSLRNLFYESIF